MPLKANPANIMCRFDVPEGYSYDESFDMYTTAEYGEWVLRVKKD